MHGGQISLPISDGPLRAAAESPVALTYKRGLAPASQRNDPLQFGYLARPWLYNDGNNRPSDRVTNAWRALRVDHQADVAPHFIFQASIFAVRVLISAHFFAETLGIKRP